MSRNTVPFTPEQKEALAANPFTLIVSDYQIRFFWKSAPEATLHGKRFSAKQGMILTSWEESE